MPLDKQSPLLITISQTASDQLDALRRNPPKYWDDLADNIDAQIDTHIGPWTPRSERGGSGIIKWCPRISEHCNANIYRLKVPEEMDNWRVFFFMLDMDKPPTRHVAEIVEWESNYQCYDDLTQPHLKRLRLLTTQFKNSDQLRLMR